MMDPFLSCKFLFSLGGTFFGFEVDGGSSGERGDFSTVVQLGLAG